MLTEQTTYRYAAMLLWGAIVLVLLDSLTALPAGLCGLLGFVTAIIVYVYTEPRAARPYDHAKDGL